MGEIAFAIGVALLAPLSGFILLIVGELIRVLRLVAPKTDFGALTPCGPSGLSYAFRKQAAKWGISFTMLIFTFALKDRVAELLALVSVFVWTVVELA
jgi:hypothetical protein